jgi:hypothetical protein
MKDETLEAAYLAGFNAKQARALDKMAENARELGLDYEPAHVQPVATLFGSLPVYDTTPPAAQPAPPECQTEAEKTAFAFGWWKALESVRQPAVPDAIIEAGESPDYRDGWNDCRQTMLKAREV